MNRRTYWKLDSKTVFRNTQVYKQIGWETDKASDTQKLTSDENTVATARIGIKQT